MHNVVVEKPYVFVPPYSGTVWPWLLLKTLRRGLRRVYGIHQVECRGVEQIHQSLKDGNGVLLAPNHCRPADPLVIGEMSRQAGLLPHTMASSHLFATGRMQSWVLQRTGAFSVYREGVDRQAISAAISVLHEGRRPLVIFPEGHVTRSNARLAHLMEGTAFIARNAAKKRAHEKKGQVVIHPIALKYFYRGDVHVAIGPALDEIERRMSWRPHRHLPLNERIVKVGQGLLALKEIEHFGRAQDGTTPQRLVRLIDNLLSPLETQWFGNSEPELSVVDRVKKLRAAVLPDMIHGEITAEEREIRWRQLADMYLAQQLSCYPPDYLSADPTPERLLETVERFEEDLTDKCRVYRPMTAVAEVGKAIVVPPGRERGSDEDPVMAALQRQLSEMIAVMK